MSTASECASCPFNRGFDPEPGRILEVCAAPSERCIDLKGKLIDRLATWMRFSSIAESAKEGILRFSDLSEGDFIHIASSVPGQGYATASDRDFRVQIKYIEDSKLHGTVISDSYLERDELELRRYAMQPGCDVILYGAYDKQGVSPENSDEWAGQTVGGQLHCGRYISYGHPETRGDGYDIGLYLQEAIIIDPDQLLAMRVFATDPNVHREAPPLPS